MGRNQLFEVDQIEATLIFPGEGTRKINQAIPDLSFLNQLDFSDFIIRRLIAYFKPEEGQTLDDCRLAIKYTKAAWHHAIRVLGGGPYPLVAYLSYEKGKWAKSWETLTVKEHESPEDKTRQNKSDRQECRRKQKNKTRQENNE